MAVIVLASCYSEEEDCSPGNGADRLGKPSMAELLAQFRAVMRRLRPGVSVSGTVQLTASNQSSPGASFLADIRLT